ncbi:MAG TPA: hypothetical protein VEZ14_01245 [Dehalococcoidia bacterium]|nr:hypothetical protein [Dehalococcoidia bacterium]
MALRSARVLPVAIAVLLAASCGGSSTGTPAAAGTPAASTTARPGGPGSIIYTTQAGLDEYSLKSHTSKPLVRPDNKDTFLLDPAVSPDGTLIAYVSQPPPKTQGNTYDAGSDLWVANRDGSNPHAVFVHAVPNQLVRAPQWEDEAHILAIVQELTTARGVTNVTYTLERIDAASGQRTNLLTDVVAFGLSPDHKRVVYARLAQQGGETLVAVDLAGGAPATLVDATANLAPFNSPRYSPDGKAIAFASADQTGARANVTYVSSRSLGPAGRPALDGLPEDIWTVPASGGTPRRVADIKEDLPALAWSGDGKHIYVLGANALYDVNLATGAIDKLGPGSFHGQLAWTP